MRDRLRTAKLLGSEKLRSDEVRVSPTTRRLHWRGEFSEVLGQLYSLWAFGSLNIALMPVKRICTSLRWHRHGHFYSGFFIHFPLKGTAEYSCRLVIGVY